MKCSAVGKFFRFNLKGRKTEWNWFKWKLDATEKIPIEKTFHRKCVRWVFAVRGSCNIISNTPMLVKTVILNLSIYGNSFALGRPNLLQKYWNQVGLNAIAFLEWRCPCSCNTIHEVAWFPKFYCCLNIEKYFLFAMKHYNNAMYFITCNTVTCRQ